MADESMIKVWAVTSADGIFLAAYLSKGDAHAHLERIGGLIYVEHTSMTLW